MNSTLIGKPPAAAEMRGWAKDRKGIRAIEATKKILSWTMPVISLLREEFLRHEPGRKPRERERPPGRSMMDAAQKLAGRIRSPGAQRNLGCKQRQLIAGD